MKKSQVISISSGVILFVVTNLALNDLLGRHNMVVTAMIGGVSALFAFWWSYKVLPKWKPAQKVIYTLLYLTAVVIFAAYVAHRTETERKLQLVGKWISPPNDEGESELIFEFKPNDSLIVTVDSQRVALTYEIKKGDQILALGESEGQEFRWRITGLTVKKLIIGDGGKTMELERTE